MTGEQQQNIGQPKPSESRPQATQSSPVARNRRLSHEEGRVGGVLNGRFRLVELIGKGGMAVVYRAEDLVLGATVAIKMLLSHVEEDSSMVERFVREAKSSSRVTHPNLVKLLDFGEDEHGSPFIVIEYLPGRSLASVIKEHQILGVNRTIHIFTQICDAVGAAHAKGVVHRDLKPSNVMLIETDDTEDFVKVVDFGLAKQSAASESQQLTQTGEIFGSPLYMSPEQCRGEVVDFRSDMYSLGIMLYEALTGKVPFHAENMVATISKHMNEVPQSFQQVRPDLYIPERLEAVVRKVLSKSPEDRYASMSEFKEALIAAVPGRRQTAELRGTLPGKQGRMKLSGIADEKSNYMVVGVAVLVAVVVISAFTTAALFTSQFVQQSSQAPVAQPTLVHPSVKNSANTPGTSPVAPPINSTASSSNLKNAQGAPFAADHASVKSTDEPVKSATAAPVKGPVLAPVKSTDTVKAAATAPAITAPTKSSNVKKKTQVSKATQTRTKSASTASGGTHASPVKSANSGNHSSNRSDGGSFDGYLYRSRYRKTKESDNDTFWRYTYRNEGNKY